MSPEEYVLNNYKLDRFFEKCKIKYLTYGKVCGNIVLDNISLEEAKSLQIVFFKIYTEGSTVKINVDKFRKALRGTKLETFDFIKYFKLVDKNFEEITNKERKQNELDEFYQYLKEMPIIMQLKKIILDKDNKNLSTVLRGRYKKNKYSLRKELIDISLLLENVPNRYTLLSVYSSLTGDSHYLDFQNNNLFYMILAIMYKRNYENTIKFKKELLKLINVYSDLISNYVNTYKLLINDIFDFLYDNYGVINLNLENINNVSKINGIGNKIFIFENPSVINYLKDNNLNISIVVCNGMPNNAMMELIDRIDCSCDVYYHGDFDPEGLLIASKIKEKCKRVKFLGYDEKNYYLSKPVKSISKSRLHKLLLVNDIELLELKNCLLKESKAGYEENLLENIRIMIKIIINYDDK